MSYKMKWRYYGVRHFWNHANRDRKRQMMLGRKYMAGLVDGIISSKT